MKVLLLVSDNDSGIEVNVSTFAAPEEREADSVAGQLLEFLEEAIDSWIATREMDAQQTAEYMQLKALQAGSLN